MRTSDPAAPGGTSFSAALRELFVLAGSPSLRTTAGKIGTARGARISAQRISDWRNGNHLPKDFATIEPLLLWLTMRARGRDQEDPLLSIEGWRRLWAAAREGVVPDSPVAVPYPGTAPMTAADAVRFHGRTAECAALTRMVEACRDRPPAERVVLVTGPSGSGKSSLVGAGLPPDPAADRTLVLDDFAEVLAGGAVPEEQVLADLVARLEATDSTAVLVVRSDHRAHAARHPVLAAALGERELRLGPPPAAGLTEACTEPARSAGVRTDAGLADLLIRDVGLGDCDPVGGACSDGLRAGRLPLFAYCLRALWDRHAGNRITMEDYRQAGGVAGMVADLAESAWAGLAPADAEKARGILLSMVSIGAEDREYAAPGAFLLRRRRYDEVVAAAGGAAVVEELVRGRVLVAGLADGYGMLEIAHEALVGSWPRMRDWLGTHAVAIEQRDIVIHAAQRWVGADRSPGLLYSAAQLAASGHQGGTGEAILPGAAREFLAASRRAARHTRRIRRTLAAAAVVLVTGLAVLTALAVDDRIELRTDRRAADHARISAASDRLLDADPAAGGRLAVAARALAPDDPAGAGRVLTASLRPLTGVTEAHTGPVYGVAFAPDGRTVASAGNDGTIRLFAREGNQALRPLGNVSGFARFVTAVSYPAATVLLAADGAGHVTRWDVRDPQRPRETGRIAVGAGAAYDVAPTADGALVAAPSDDGTVTLVDPRGPDLRAVGVIRADTGPLRAVAVSPAGPIVAAGGEHGGVTLWDVADPGAPRPVGTPVQDLGATVHALAFSPDGTRLAVTGDDGPTLLVDLTGPAGAPPRTVRPVGSAGASWSVRFVREGARLLLVRAAVGQLQRWDVTDPDDPRPRDPLPQGTGADRRVAAAAVSADGAIAAGAADGTIRVWPAAEPPERQEGGIARVAVAAVPAGWVAATAGTVDASVRLWRPDATGRPRDAGAVALDRPGARVALRSDGAVLATARAGSGRIDLWNTRDLRRLASIPVGTRYTDALVFTPDGQWLISGNTDSSLRAWRVPDPAQPMGGEPEHRGLGGWPSALITSLAATDDRVAVGTDDGRVRLTAFDRPVPSDIGRSGGPVAALAFSGADHLLIGAENAELWRFGGAASRRVDIALGGPVIAAQTRPDGTVVLTTELDGVTIADLHGDVLRPVATGVGTGTRLRPWAAEVDGPDGRRLLAFDRASGAPLLADPDPDPAARAVCAQTPGALEPDRWERLLPGVAPVPGC
ncbi:hypothetical protein [Tsukamurella sp. NPDC003166]|uniref:nSTAND1 domain-containing NTPase n=1 Tax=Tsukamurella sp. NPDC003166 TaxID=3154444 RepID=UPI0033A02489